MNIQGIPFSGSYLEALPLNKISRFTKKPPKEAVPFMGCPQQHPTEDNKLILVHDPFGKSPALIEFKLDDLLFVEDLPQAVTESGEGIPLKKLWIRRGARGVFMEPFEVDEPLRFPSPRQGRK